MDKAIAHVERNPHLDLADVLKADVKMETQRFITQERLKNKVLVSIIHVLISI